MEARGFCSGGPILPTVALDVLEVEKAPVAFVRTLFPSAGILTGVSTGTLESFERAILAMLSLPESEMTDGGRDMPGVVNTAESRR